MIPRFFIKYKLEIIFIVFIVAFAALFLYRAKCPDPGKMGGIGRSGQCSH